MRTLAISSQKGGVGKTTTAANLAAAWGLAGLKVLAVDVDPQFGLTRAFGLAPSHAPATSVELLGGAADLADVVVPVGERGVDLVVGHRDLSRVELSLVAEMRREEFLARALADATGYDLLVVDCPPNLGLLTVNALCAVREVVAPVSMRDPGALQGVGELRGTIAQLADRQVDVRLSAIVRTCADRRRQTYRAIAEALDELPERIADQEVPLRAEFDNALAHGRPLVLHRPDSLGARAYRRLADELRPRLEAVA